jgi:hypothetical protein
MPSDNETHVWEVTGGIVVLTSDELHRQQVPDFTARQNALLQLRMGKAPRQSLEDGVT